MKLGKINRENFYDICLLTVKPEQINHVDSNAISLAEANFMPFAWFRGIFVDDRAAGFILVDANYESGKFVLCRLMLDKRYQSCGYGNRAICALVEELKAEFQASCLYTSVVTSKGSPISFYKKQGFELTGAMVEGREVELCLTF